MGGFTPITEKHQKLYEKLYEKGIEENIPDICGYRGRACRQAGKRADKMICLDCSLRIFASTVDTIMEVCSEKEQIGIEHLYDSDILDIKDRLKTLAVNVDCEYIENVLDHLEKNTGR